jgi:hypothetical protein
MGGMNENWLILHNLFDVQTGSGVFAKDASFDHIIKDNTFVVRDTKAPFMILMTADCIGIELIDNRVYGGNARLKVGLGKLKIEKGNQILPFSEDYERVEPAIPSIFEWQKKIQLAQ